MPRLTFTAVLLVAVVSMPANANFVEDWNLSVGVIPGNVDGESNRFQDPFSPFFQNHSVMIAGLVSSAEYQFSWDSTGGSFHANTAMEIPAIPGVNRRATARAFIYINSPVSLLISGIAEFDYSLPRDPMNAKLGIGVTSGDGIEVLGGETAIYSTAFNGAQSGFLDAEFHDVLIPANETFIMLYSFTIDTFAGVPVPSLATGIGSAHFEITAVPEPATALLVFAAAIPLALRRFKRRSAMHLTAFVS